MEVRLGVVYKLTIGKYFIIGSTIDDYQRFAKYKSLLRDGLFHNRMVQNVYNKYNKGEKLSFEILQDNIPELILRDIENIWIGAKCAMRDDDKGGMNMQQADQCNKSKETIERMRLAQIGGIKSQATRDKIRDSRLGTKQSLETLNKKSKPVIQTDKFTGEQIAVFNSAREASRVLGINQGSISRNCNNERKHAGNYIFKYN